jgi:translocator assembly and maintenance protein 41
MKNDSMSSAERSLGQLTGTEDLESIVDRFPNIVHSFGYGSGVFQQQALDETAAPGMIDLILVTENDAKGFHQENLACHASHYSTMTRLGGHFFCQHVQRDYGAGVFFHAMIPMQHSVIKYGVVTEEDLSKDLKHWNHLYLAGRLHKPTVCIRASDVILEYQEIHNLPFAASTALLMLGESMRESISLAKLYEQISHLSYAGDPRMGVGGEDPDKVQKLVHSPGQLDRFHQLYKSPLQQLEQAGIISLSHDQLHWNPTEARQGLRERLPPRLRHSTNLGLQLRKIVASAATSQAIKGIVTAGLAKSARYALAKLSKGLFKR